jgi:hypothetical protein
VVTPAKTVDKQVFAESLHGMALYIGASEMPPRGSLTYNEDVRRELDDLEEVSKGLAIAVAAVEAKKSRMIKILNRDIEKMFEEDNKRRKRS